MNTLTFTAKLTFTPGCEECRKVAVALVADALAQPNVRTFALVAGPHAHPEAEKLAPETVQSLELFPPTGTNGFDPNP